MRVALLALTPPGKRIACLMTPERAAERLGVVLRHVYRLARLERTYFGWKVQAHTYKRKRRSGKPPRPVIRVASDGTRVTYPSITAAVLSTPGATDSNISKVLNGNQRTHAGYLWLDPVEKQT